MTTTARCPHCKAIIFMERTPATNNTRRIPTNTFAATAPLPEQFAAVTSPTTPPDWYKSTPIGRIETNDVWANLLDAGVSGTFAAIGISALSWYLNWPLVSGPAVGFTLAAWRYFDGMRHALRLLEIIEEVRPDKSPDTPPDTPPPSTVIVRTEVKEGDTWKFATYPIQPAILQQYARALLNGNATFGEKSAGNNNIGPTKFNALRNTFIEQGFANWRDPNNRKQGAELTKKGRAVLKGIITTPLPNP